MLVSRFLVLLTIFNPRYRAMAGEISCSDDKVPFDSGLTMGTEPYLRVCDDLCNYNSFYTGFKFVEFLQIFFPIRDVVDHWFLYVLNVEIGECYRIINPISAGRSMSSVV